MRSQFSVRALLLFAAFLLAGSPVASKAQASFTLSGSVQLEGYYWNPAWGNAPPVVEPTQTVVFVFTPSPGATITRSAQVGPNGVFSLSNIPANTYTVWIKSDKWLAKNVLNVGPNNASITVQLPTGDAIDDNSVDSSDFGVLIGVYGSDRTIPGSGYDPTADFNSDGLVDSTDFGFLINNFNAVGDPLTGSIPQLYGSIIWDVPAPDYGVSTVPMDGSSEGGAVNLTSGVYENHPGVDLDAFNPVGAIPAYVRTYHSGRASQGYGSPGLSPGWIDNYDYTIFAPPLTGGGYGPMALSYPNGALDIITTPPQPVAAPSPATALSGGDCLLNAPAQVPYFVTGKIGAQGIWTAIYITFADNMQMVFTPVGVTGLYRYTALWDLKHDAGALGRTLSIARNANGSVSSISNDQPAASTLLNFNYSGGGSGSLTSVQDMTDSNNIRSVQYDWDGSGQLHKVYQINEAASTGHFLWQYTYAAANAAAPGSLWTLLHTITVPTPNTQITPQPITLTYDNLGRVQSVADENGNTRQYAYLSGSATTVTVATSGTASQSWTQNFSRNRGTGVSQTYPDANNPANTISVNTSVAYFEFNPYLIDQTTDQNSNITKYIYDGTTGNLTSVEKPINGSSVTTSYTYLAAVNPLGWLARIDATPNAAGEAAKIPTTFDYYDGTMQGSGLRGQIAAIHTPTPGVTNPGNVMNPQLAANWLPYQVTTSFTYTPLGNIATVASPGPNSALINGVPGAEGTFTTSFGYTRDSYTQYSNDHTALTTSEALGEPLTVTTPFETGGVVGTRMQHYRYDGRGNLTATISDSGNIRTDYLYNLANQPKYTVAPALAQPGTMTTRLVSTVTYAYLGGPPLSVASYGDPLDTNDPLTGQLDQEQFLLRQVNTTYGAAQEVKSLTGSTAPVNLAYDKAYQLAGLADANASATSHSSQFQYDGGGNLFKHTWPGGKSVGMGYDGSGNLLSTTTARGTTASLTYSGDHTVVNGLSYSNAPHPNLTLPNAIYQYDGFGRVTDISETVTATNDPAYITTELAYTYDDCDNVLSVVTTYKAPANSGLTCPLPQAAVYSYNTDGTIGDIDWYQINPQQIRVDPKSNFRLASLKPTRRQQQSNWSPTIKIKKWNDGGCFPKTDTQTIYPATPLPNCNLFQTKNKYRFDTDGHLLNETNDAVSVDHGFCGPCLAAALGYTIQQNPFSCIVPVQALAVPVSSLPSYNNYLYNPLNMLLNYRTDYNGGVRQNGTTTITTYHYDDNHAAAAQNRDRLMSETYDRLVPNQNNPNVPTQTTVYNQAYTPDAADNLTQVRSQTYAYNVDNQITDNAQTYPYDDDGNMMGISTNSPLTMTYDAANRLTSYTYRYFDQTNPSISLTFGYRPDGLRAWKQSGGVRTYYFYNGSQLQFEMRQTAGAWAMTRCFSWGASGIYESWNPTEGGVAYCFDPQGSVVSRYTQLGPNAQSWTDNRVYDAYGKMQSYDATADQTDPVGYNGQSGYYTDVASGIAIGNTTLPGLILCSHRYYSPDLARWLTRDPLGYEGGINVYAYCDNSPIGNLDPSGLWSFYRWLYTGDGNASDDVYRAALNQAGATASNWLNHNKQNHKHAAVIAGDVCSAVAGSYPAWPDAKSPEELKKYEALYRGMGKDPAEIRKLTFKARRILQAIGKKYGTKSWQYRAARKDVVAMKNALKAGNLGKARAIARGSVVAVAYFEAIMAWWATYQTFQDPLIDDDD